MFAHHFHRITHPHIAGRPRRIIATMAAAIGGLLAWTAVIPAASAAIIPITPDGPYKPATTPLVYAGGMPGWQITVIALAAALVTATTAVFLDRAWDGRRSASTTS
jgi:hypothetical protein